MSLFKEYAGQVKRSVNEISASQAYERMQEGKSHLIDVRETFEWNEEHIPGAVYLGRGFLERDIVMLTVAYCRNQLYQTPTNKSLCTALVVSDHSWLLILSRKWVTQMLCLWLVVSEAGKKLETLSM